MNNPYSAPTAEFSSMQETGSDTYEPRFFSMSGRIGRLRYLAYSWGASMLVSIFFGVLIAATGSGRLILTSLIYIAMAAASLIMTRRRLQDLDRSGWVALLMLVPLLNVIVGLYLIFASGTEGPNQYGLPPAKNSGLLILGAFALPVVIGILAAIAIPAYQGYVQKAKQAQMGHSQ